MCDGRGGVTGHKLILTLIVMEIHMVEHIALTTERKCVLE